MQWICDEALKRADTFGIPGVNYNLTMQVVKNIIPAIASTNALVSAACVTECWKALTGCSPLLKNYMQYMGQTGVSTTTYESGREPDCLVCAFTKGELAAKKTDTLEQMIEALKA
jgi:ubiquitin-activating enzyme E1 C